MNKFKKFTRRIVCSLIVLVLCAGILSGCDFFSSSKLSTPAITINKDSYILTFDANYSASAYEVYLNESIITTIKEDTSSSQHSFNYYEYLPKTNEGKVKAGEYRFQLKAIGGGDYTDGKKTIVSSVVYGDATDVLDNNLSLLNSNEVYYKSSDKLNPSKVNITGKKITWSDPSETTDFDIFVISIYSNTLGVKNVETELKEYTLSDKETYSHDVVVVRVGARYNDGTVYASNLLFYNPMDMAERGIYTDNYYIFKGGVYDYYIENLDELKNIYYYAFIYRLESLDFMVSKEFYNNYSDTYFDTMTGAADDYILLYSYYETYGFVSMPTLSKKNTKTDEKVFNLACKYSVKEPDYADPNKNDPELGQAISTPYYETISESSVYKKRDIKTHEFVSDGWMLSTIVTSSEELLWAVTNHVTPIITDETSRAALIYAEAKKTLCNIIYDGMTDYEKVLSIFDYIMNNSTYDWKTYNLSLNEYNNINPMDRACYYLEGMFLSDTHVVVCDAMSKSFAFLCNMEGVDAVRVVGNAKTDSGEGGHAWNKVYIDNKWYVVDITWTELNTGDQMVGYAVDWIYPYLIYYNDASKELSCHKYFLVDDEYIKDDHIPFENEPLYKMMSTTEYYSFYEKPLTGTTTRVIESGEELRTVLDYMLKNDVQKVELVFDIDYIKANGGTVQKCFMSTLKNGEPVKYLFGSQSFVIYQAQTYNKAYMVEDEDGIEIEFSTGDGSGSTTKKTVYYYLPESLLKFAYNNSGDEGVFVVVGTNVSLLSDLRLQKYLEYALSNNLSKSSNVSISKELIDATLTANGVTESELAEMTDEQRITKFAEIINTMISNQGVNKQIVITRVENTSDETETSLVQQDDGTYKEMEQTVGRFNIVFEAIQNQETE